MNSTLLTSQPVFSSFRITLMNVILKKWVKYFLFFLFLIFFPCLLLFLIKVLQTFSAWYAVDVLSPPPPWKGTARSSQLFTSPVTSPNTLLPAAVHSDSISHCLLPPPPALYHSLPRITPKGQSAFPESALTLNQTCHVFSYSCLLRRENIISQPMGKFFLT